MKRINKFLVVQGRLLPQIENSIQYFPDSWKSEFPLISQTGFDGIEWIYDKHSEISNPILTKEGQNEIHLLSKKYHVGLENIVFDWFLVHPLLHNDEFTIRQKIDKLLSLIQSSYDSKFKRIIFPLLEKNSISNSQELNDFIDLLKNNVVKILEENQIEFHIETSLSPKKESFLLEKVDSDLVKVCFDMGNSTSFGFEPQSTLNSISDFLGSVHIKDRNLHGPSVPLGRGDVNFPLVFDILKKLDFSGPISFQLYRNKDSNNIQILSNAKNYVEEFFN